MESDYYYLNQEENQEEYNNNFIKTIRSLDCHKRNMVFDYIKQNFLSYFEKNKQELQHNDVDNIVIDFKYLEEEQVVSFGLRLAETKQGKELSQTNPDKERKLLSDIESIMEPINFIGPEFLESEETYLINIKMDNYQQCIEQEMNHFISEQYRDKQKRLTEQFKLKNNVDQKKLKSKKPKSQAL